MTSSDATFRPDGGGGFADLGLNALLVRNLARMGIRRPTPIQVAAIPLGAEGRDIVGLAHTGTGKTAAFITAAAERLLRERRAGAHARRTRAGRPLVVVVSPTREIAVQCAAEAERLLTGCRMRVVCVTGRSGLRPQAEDLERGVEVLVGTPGRLRELAEAEACALDAVRIIVLDEGDRLLDMGFLPQVNWLLDRMPALDQRLLFSATMPAPVERLAARILREPARIEVDPQAQAVEHVRQTLMRLPDAKKIERVLALFAEGHGRGTVIFCRTRRRVGWVGAALHRHGIRAGILHGDRSPAQRRTTLAAFESGTLDALVATDVAARGLHIERIRTVINYDLPLEPREFVHRVGRAGHGGGFGEAFTLLSPLDEARWEKVRMRVKPTIREVAATAEAAPAAPTPRRSPPPAGARPEPTGRAARGRQSTRTKASPPPARERGRRPRGTAHGAVEGARPKRRPVGDKPRSGRRGASRPIAPGEKPGRGVRRPGSPP